MDQRGQALSLEQSRAQLVAGAEVLEHGDAVADHVGQSGLRCAFNAPVRWRRGGVGLGQDIVAELGSFSAIATNSFHFWTQLQSSLAAFFDA